MHKIKASLVDTLNLLSKLTGRKLLNYFTLKFSFFYSKISGRICHLGFPVSIAIEPTTSCNLRCPECPSGLRSFTRPTGLLQTDVFEKVVNELHHNLVYLTLYFQGEPYLHPDFHKLVQYSVSKRIYTATSTNAHYLTPENAEKTVRSGLDRLIISIDGTTQDVYQQYRVGGKLSKVIEGTRNIVEAKKKLKSKKPYLIFQFLVVGPNEHQIGEVKKLAKDLGIDAIKYKTAQIYNYEKGSPLIPLNNKYSRYKKTEEGEFILKSEVKNGCRRLWENPVVTWNGLVVPCCFDKDAQHQLGDLKQSDFMQVWRNNRYREFREKVFTSRKEIDICGNCSEGSKIWG